MTQRDNDPPVDWMRIDAETCLQVAESEPDWIASEWPHQDEAKRKLLAILRILAGRT